MLESLQADHDCVKNQQRQQLQEQRESLEWSHSTAVNELNDKVQPHIRRSLPIGSLRPFGIESLYSRHIKRSTNKLME